MKKRFCMLLGIALLMTTCTLDGGNLIGPAGGFVFYDKGSYSGGWRYLECAPENAGTGSWDNVQQRCADYACGGYDDWRLPTIDELKNLLDNGHGYMFNNGVYWSSSEDAGAYAWGIQNGDSPTPGSGSSSGKAQDPATYGRSEEYWARPVRQF
jgi:hypothetical protein